jgi:hypothetical protein
VMHSLIHGDPIHLSLPYSLLHRRNSLLEEIKEHISVK